MHQSGFVNIIGNPNIGKSTLMNAILGEKLSIITKKAQTTRHRIMGIINEDDYQIVLSDTPGILDPAYKMQEKMMSFVNMALSDADVFVVMTSPQEKKYNVPEVIEHVKASGVPIIVVINKVDKSTQEEVQERVKEVQEEFPGAEIIAMSARENFNVDALMKAILDVLPEGPEYFPKDQIADRTERFFMSEIIREKIFLHVKQEVPYSCEVRVEEFKEEEDIVRIRAIIYVARSSQKSIIIGQGGSMIKRIGMEARKDMEKFLGKKVFLETYVKVMKDWRDSEDALKRFGYNQ